MNRYEENRRNSFGRIQPGFTSHSLYPVPKELLNVPLV
jgi:hypothetical protein